MLVREEHDNRDYARIQGILLSKNDEEKYENDRISK
jgi:hypothetical protein